MSQIIIHTFSKAEVERLNFERFENSFGHWPSLRNGELRAKLDSLCLKIDGFNLQSEELYHIPSTRRFYQELHRRWPWWLYFLNVSNEGMAIPYLCLLEQIDAINKNGSLKTRAIFNPTELLGIIRTDFPRMNYLFENAGLCDEKNNERTDAILQLFCGSVLEKGAK